jgi:hypothetical protein
VTKCAHRWPARLNEAGRSAKVSALISALTIACVALAADGQTSVSWVPYQIGCPILLLDLETDTNVHAAVFGSIDVQNVSSGAVEEITVGALVRPHASGTPGRLVASHTVMASIAPGELAPTRRSRCGTHDGAARRVSDHARGRPGTGPRRLGVGEPCDHCRRVYGSELAIHSAGAGAPRMSGWAPPAVSARRSAVR